MIEPKTIPKIASDQDTYYEALLSEGITLLQQLSGEIWTDYNEHDPGITILENLCYVLTELYDRADIGMQDLLTDANGKMDLNKNALYSAPDILFNAPTTINDYRKVIIDQVETINNVWIQPVYCNADPGQLIGIPGFYEVFADLNENLIANKVFSNNASSDNTSVSTQIQNILIANRKMCESLTKITILEQVPTCVFFNIYLKDATDVEQVLAGILFNIKHFLKPGIDFYTYEELVAQGLSTTEIFDGPKLDNGFIPDAELTGKLQILYIDSLLKLIIQTKEVASVDSVSIVVNDTVIPAQYPIPENNSLTLNLMESLGGKASPNNTFPVNGIKIYRRGVQVPYNRNKVVSLFNALEGQKRKNRNFKLSKGNHTMTLPTGQYRDPAYYHSLQHEFPRIYGIGDERLQKNAKNSRKAQALQLKAYLLFYEQLLSDSMKQTSSISELFSVQPQDRTFFYQPLYSVPDAPPLLKGFKGSPDEIYDSKQGHQYYTDCTQFTSDPENEYLKGLQNIYEKTDDFLPRRNAFLDHLLARFNFELDLHPVLSSGTDTTTSFEMEDVISTKQSLLQNIPLITATRGNFNPTNIGLDTDVTLRFCSMLHTLTGISYADPSLNTNGIYSILHPVSAVANSYLFRHDTHEQLEININHTDFSAALVAGLLAENYSAEKYHGEHYLYLKTDSRTLRVCRITAEEMQNLSSLTQKLITDFFFMYLRHENIFIIDHIRLLPDLTENKFMWKERNAAVSTKTAAASYTSTLDSITTAFQQAEHTSLKTLPDPLIGVLNEQGQFIHQDFYAAKISVIIPENAVDLKRNSSYRNYFHTIVVNSVPAHVCLQVFWLPEEEYNQFIEWYAPYILEQDDAREKISAFLLRQGCYSNFIVTK